MQFEILNLKEITAKIHRAEIARSTYVSAQKREIIPPTFQHTRVGMEGPCLGIDRFPFIWCSSAEKILARGILKKILCCTTCFPPPTSH